MNQENDTFVESQSKGIELFEAEKEWLFQLHEEMKAELKHQRLQEDVDLEKELEYIVDGSHEPAQFPILLRSYTHREAGKKLVHGAMSCEHLVALKFMGRNNIEVTFTKMVSLRDNFLKSYFMI